MTLGIGETLYGARRRQRLTLSDAAAETRIRESYLAALEEEEFSVLGGDVYVRGFLRNYAKYLGIDGEPLVETFRAEHQTSDENASFSPAAVPSFSAQGDPPARWKIIAGVAGTVVLLVFFVGRCGQDTADQDEPMVGPEPTAVASTAPGGRAGAASAPSRPGDASSRTPSPLQEIDAVMEVTGGDSWTRATVDGSFRDEGFKAPGTTREYQADESLVLRLGDAGNVRLRVNGDDLGVIGGDGEVWEVRCEVGMKCRTERKASAST